MKHQMFAVDTATSVRTIVAQLEAASTLIKFAADDLESYADHANPAFRDELRHIAANWQKSAGSLFEHALYLERIDSGEEEDGQALSAGRRKRPQRQHA